MSSERNDGGPANEGSLRDYAAIQFIAAWIPALVKRNDTYDEAVAEAHDLGSSQADLFIRTREGK